MSDSNSPHSSTGWTYWDEEPAPHIVTLPCNNLQSGYTRRRSRGQRQWWRDGWACRRWRLRPRRGRWCFCKRWRRPLRLACRVLCRLRPGPLRVWSLALGRWRFRSRLVRWGWRFGRGMWYWRMRLLLCRLFRCSWLWRGEWRLCFGWLRRWGLRRWWRRGLVLCLRSEWLWMLWLMKRWRW